MKKIYRIYMNQNIINFDTYIYNYFIKWFDIVYPKNSNIIEKIIIIFFHFIHILVIGFNFIGAFLPPKYLIIYIIFTLLLVSTWYIYGRCPVLYATYNIDKKNYDFIPLENTTRLTILGILFISAVFGYIYPEYSLFRIIKNVIIHISVKYDN